LGRYVIDGVAVSKVFSDDAGSRLLFLRYLVAVLLVVADVCMAEVIVASSRSDGNLSRA